MNELEVFYDEVAKVAYDLFEKRGMFHGFDMEDWLEAEMIVQKRYLKKTEQAPIVAGPQADTKVMKKSKTKTGKQSR